MQSQEEVKTVLLVEDFEDSRFMMRMLLEMSGYRVVEATDGREAVDCARRVCPDVILMDLSLPVMDGISATRHIRRQENLCDVPVIAVTAHDSEDYYDAARRAGCDEYVTKPVDYDRLDALLARYCRTA
ncbi:MAG: response regulator [Pyrinomonadaceae bacterium]